ncbi:MAG TPA: hypothetical protein VME47_02395 [Acetobacteraceae bacterium]|nr:hypothetical protein [Acetobacteraceae bacterium]
MIDTPEDTRSRPRPLLLRFLTRLQPQAFSIAYDREAQLNVLAGRNIPAVYGGADVKTLMEAPGGED